MCNLFGPESNEPYTSKPYSVNEELGRDNEFGNLIAKAYCLASTSLKPELYRLFEKYSRLLSQENGGETDLHLAVWKMAEQIKEVMREIEKETANWREIDTFDFGSSTEGYCRWRVDLLERKDNKGCFCIRILNSRFQVDPFFQIFKAVCKFLEREIDISAIYKIMDRKKEEHNTTADYNTLWEDREGRVIKSGVEHLHEFDCALGEAFYYYFYTEQEAYEAWDGVKALYEKIPVWYSPFFGMVVNLLVFLTVLGASLILIKKVADALLFIEK